MIPATCHTADNARALEFDATPSFNEADAESVVELAQRVWSRVWSRTPSRDERDMSACTISFYAADRLETESIEDPTWNTFECVVDGQQAFRPEVASMIAGAASP